MPSQLLEGARQLGFLLTDAQLHAFEVYQRELLEWNQRFNLTRIVDPAEIAAKHFLDSLSVAGALRHLPATAALIDVGSGPGFPGLPLKIVQPGWRVTLLESTGKKARFLEHLVNVLKLPGVTVLVARAEEAGQNPAHRARYDVAVARAVASLPVLAEYLLPLVKVGGLAVAQKGQSPAAEIVAAANALGMLGGRVAQVVPVSVPFLAGERHLVVINKKRATPPQYPRRPGLPAQKPL